MNAIRIKPGQQAETALAIERLVSAARVQFAVDPPDAEFDADCWEISSWNPRTTTTSYRLFFTRYGNLQQPLPSIYANVIKSWLVLERRTSVTHLWTKLEAARLLWEAILARRKPQAEAFSWESLCEEDLQQAELLMREKWKLSSVYQNALRLAGLAGFLATRGICRPLYYSPQTPRP
jgi:hypothetical protein